MVDNRIKVGIIGYGLSGAVFHGPLIRVNKAFVVVCIVTQQSQKALGDFPKADIHSDYLEVIQRADIDLVVVCVPNHLHHEICLAALNAGKHVVVEKPFVISLSAAEHLMAFAREKNRILTVFQNRRWDGDFLTVKRVMNEGLIGTVLFYEANFDRFRPVVEDRWKETVDEGGGVFYDLGPHLIDQALELFGEPDAVFLDLARQRHLAKNDDYFHMSLRYGERRVVLRASKMVCHSSPRYVLHGEKGSLWKIGGMDPQEDQLRSGMLPGAKGWGVADKDHFEARIVAPQSLGVDFQSNRIAIEVGCYEEFYARLALAIQGGGDPPVDMLSALRVVKALEKGVLSHNLGRWVGW